MCINESSNVSEQMHVLAANREMLGNIAVRHLVMMQAIVLCVYVFIVCLCLVSMIFPLCVWSVKLLMRSWHYMCNCSLRYSEKE